jgi:hypothetical protein
MGRYSLVPLRHLWLCPLYQVAITADRIANRFE